MTDNKRRDILGPGLLKVKKNVSDKHEKQLKTAISRQLPLQGLIEIQFCSNANELRWNDDLCVPCGDFSRFSTQ
jgi:hypothetical protein